MSKKIVLFLVLLLSTYATFLGVLELINLTFRPDYFILSNPLYFVVSIVLNFFVFFLVVNFHKFSPSVVSSDDQYLSKRQYFLLFLGVFYTQIALYALTMGFLVITWGLVLALPILLMLPVAILITPFLFARFIKIKTNSSKKALFFVLMMLILNLSFVLIAKAITNYQIKQKIVQEHEEVDKNRLTYDQAVNEIQNCKVNKVFEDTTPGHLDLIFVDGNWRFLNGVNPEKLVTVVAESSVKCGFHIEFIAIDDKILN